MATTDDKDKKIGEVPHLEELTGEEKIPVSADGEPRYVEVQQIVDMIPQFYATTTYEELKTLRDNAKLKKGCWYRITNYECTTTQTDTMSAGHVFDLLILATDVDKLSECGVRALLHDGDEYFVKNKLESWQIWYCLDNDTTRFAWSDSTNGKGVIYRMIDEFNNDVPYDFKNIMFKRCKVTNTKFSDFNDTYVGIPGMSSIGSVAENDFIWCYTFSRRKNQNGTFVWKIESDGSLYSNPVVSGTYPVYGQSCYNNSIKSNPQGLRNEAKLYLNNIVFLGGSSANGTLVHFTYGNSFGAECRQMTFVGSCIGNEFEGTSSNNIFLGECSKSKFGIGCGDNIFFGECSNNKLGNDCTGNVFGVSRYNTFGGGCSQNDLSKCQCTYNTFGNSCYGNLFENTNTNNVNGLTLTYCHFADATESIHLHPKAEGQGTYDSIVLTNINIHSGVHGDKSWQGSAKLDIEIDTYGQDYEINISKDKDGNIVKWINGVTVSSIAFSELTTPSLTIAMSNSKDISIQAGNQYYNDIADRTITEYNGFSTTTPSATILSSSPLTFEGDNVLTPVEVPKSDYLLYKIEYVQTSDIKFILVVSVTAMKAPQGGLKGEDMPVISTDNEK